MKRMYVLMMAALMALIPYAGFSAVKPACKKPDLVMHSIKIDDSNLKRDGKVIVLYTVKNRGNTVAAASKAQIVQASPGTNLIIQQNIPKLAPGSTYTNRVTYTVASGKNYKFNGVVDYNNNIDESNELNNRNSVSLSVQRAL